MKNKNVIKRLKYITTSKHWEVDWFTKIFDSKIRWYHIEPIYNPCKLEKTPNIYYDISRNKM